MDMNIEWNEEHGWTQHCGHTDTHRHTLMILPTTARLPTIHTAHNTAQQQLIRLDNLTLTGSDLHWQVCAHYK